MRKFISGIFAGIAIIVFAGGFLNSWYVQSFSKNYPNGVNIFPVHFRGGTVVYENLLQKNIDSVFWILFPTIIVIGVLFSFLSLSKKKNSGHVLISDFSKESNDIQLYQDEKIINEILGADVAQYGLGYYRWWSCSVLITNRRIILGTSYPTGYSFSTSIFYTKQDYENNYSKMSWLSGLRAYYYLNDFYKKEGVSYFRIQSKYSLFNVSATLKIMNEVVFDTVSKYKNNTA